MMGLCKNVNSLLELHETDEHRRSSPHRRRGVRHLPGEGLRIFSGSPGLRDRFHRDMLRLCTENLGSESCEGTLEPEEEAALEAAATEEAVVEGEVEDVDRPVSRRRERRREIPPPLRWMANDNGRPAGFIKAVREGGRLILREVRIERPEVLHATREDGRLRLRLIEEELFEESPEEETEEASPMSKLEEEEGERWEWQGGEGLSRCQEAASGNREVPAWWQHRFATMA